MRAEMLPDAAAMLQILIAKLEPSSLVFSSWGLREGRLFEQLDPAAKARETLVMGLRRTAGWGREEFRKATGFDYDVLRGPEIARLAAEGRLVAEPDRIRLADEALFVSDGVFAELV